MSLDNILSFEGKATAEYSKKIVKLILDYTELERFKGKIEELGTIRKKKFLIVCDGKGKIRVREIKDWSKRLKILNKMKNSLTETEYKKIKKSIIDDETNS